MDNFVQDGNVVDHIATAAISSGDVVVMGPLIGIAVTDIANGATGAVAIEGVVTIPKNTSTAMAVSTTPYWDVSAGELAAGTPATGDVDGALVLVEAAAEAATTAKVKLTPNGGATIT